MLSRKFFTNDMWTASRAYSESEAWLDLIQAARFEASETMSRVGIHDITWGRGQLPAATSFLSRRWMWSDQNVKTYLKKLKRNGMITTDSSQGVNVITLCKYDDYNPTKKGANQSSNQLSNQLNGLSVNELQELLTSVLTSGLTNPSPDPNHNKNKAKTEKKIKEKTSTIVDAKAAPDGANCAEASENPLKTWREDFNVYRQELDAAYAVLIADNAFIAERQKYHLGVDIKLSLEKAYKDYWSAEVGWKKKKAARSKDVDWKRTFVNALSLGSNQVRQSVGKSAYVPVTESQIKFTEYLKANAPLMLNMPVHPTDEEIAELRKINPATMLSIIGDINNNRYLTNGRNSVYQTIMEIRSKYE